MLAPSAYAFKAFNVNLNQTVDFPEEPSYPKTTIQTGTTCGANTDAFTAIHNIQKERAENPVMFKSDAVLAISLPNNTATQSWVWCGIEK